MKSLGNVVLPDDLYWSNRYDWTPVQMVRKFTLGGNQYVYTKSVYAGRPFDLVATRERGWIPYSTLTQLYELSLVDNVLVLVWDSLTFNVMWRFDDPPVLDVEPLESSTVTFADDSLFIGTIKLLQV